MAVNVALTGENRLIRWQLWRGHKLVFEYYRQAWVCPGDGVHPPEWNPNDPQIPYDYPNGHEWRMVT